MGTSTEEEESEEYSEISSHEERTAAGNIEPPISSDSTTSSSSTSPSDSEQSSSSSDGNKSLKRKLQEPPQNVPVTKRRKKSSYSDAYRELLNETIEQAASRIIPIEDHSIQSSQIGISFWTYREKHDFFHHLGLRGKDDIRSLAAGIRTKSEMEVKVYLQLLQDGLFEHNYRAIRTYLLDPQDFPTAHELSSRCCKALDQAADSLARRENNYNQRMEQEKWQDLWLSTNEASDWVEDCLGEGGAGESEVQEALPAATLLKLSSWLELSDRIFMNPTSPNEEENWHYLARNEERPSIYATAFSDFHTLAVSLTKRLIQTTLFCAMSRLRAMDSGIFNVKPSVKTRDVNAALKILGLKPDSKSFWTGAARRCKLDVYEKFSVRKIRKGMIDPLTYEEVERSLKAPGEPLITDQPTPAPKESVSRQQAAQETLPANSEEDNTPTTPPSPNLSPRSSSPISSPKSESTETSDSSSAEEEEYFEAIDTEASHTEEKRLWALLKRKPPSEIKAEEVEIPKTPSYERKQKEDLVDWRDRMEFRSEWETFSKPVPSNR
ncbi:MAG: hypothetical protein M1812_003983 [Candelaria pacifica]|nr:MAG: hypothetical protein M1812_003983 [Candelaria pacifica]